MLCTVCSYSQGLNSANSLLLQEGKMTKGLRNFEESCVETFSLVKMCFTCFWFWLPALYAAFFFIQLWMIVSIHPLMILIFPAILSIYSLLQEDKRAKFQYGLDKPQQLTALHPLGSGPQELRNSRWNVERAIEEYIRSESREKQKK